jgi:NAD(P)-dependent dehydrogenase (short-subunit alcohol dehydrogenase family)
LKQIIPYSNADKLFDLHGRTCFIVGAGGIGATIAQAFAQKGAEVIIADINAHEAMQICANIQAEGGTAHAYTIDVTLKENVVKVVETVLQQFGKIDVLVNAVGVSATDSAVDFNEKAIDRILDINLKGSVFLNQSIGKVMIAQQYGKIINIGSIGGVLNHTTCTMPYSISKAAVHQLTRSFAGELSEYGINVNAIAPSWVHTPMMENRETAIYEGIRKGVPFGRMMAPHELIGAAVFLATDASNFVTGITLYVDGGYLSCKPLY